jgi:protein gp37
VSDNSAINWTDSTWNPVLGCTRVSPGCDSCYAISQARIRAANPNPKVAAAFEGLTDRADGRLDWTGRVNLLPERLQQPLRWRKPRRIFVNSLADLFHHGVPDEFIADVFAVMTLTPWHTYQLLTKQHGRMRSLLNSEDFGNLYMIRYERLAEDFHVFGSQRWRDWLDTWEPSWPLPNLHLGVSVEDQHWADIRIPALLRTPAAVRWVSAEPLLGAIDLRHHLAGYCLEHDFPAGFCVQRNHPGVRHLNWVVCGGESGAKARPMHPAWARQLRDQCIAAGVPFWFKQWGSHRWIEHSRYDDETQCWVADGIEPQRVSVKLAGRLLDGREWSEFPLAAKAAA